MVHPLFIVEYGAILSVGCLLIQICSVIMFIVFGDGYHVFMVANRLGFV